MTANASSTSPRGGPPPDLGLCRFYYGMETSSLDRKMGDVPHVLYSAALLWRPEHRTFRTPRPPPHRSLFLDSGGFRFFAVHGDYPFAPRDLAGLARRLQADVVACMDFPCERGVDREGSLRTNADRISKTVENAVSCLRIRGVRWLPVIQGDQVPEYVDCVRQLESAKAIRPYMGVGTLCRRVSRRDTLEVLSALRRELPGVRFHGFGVDLRLVRDPKVRAELHSADSSAWNWTPRSLRTEPDRRFAPTQAERLRNFHVYKSKIDPLLAERRLEWWTTSGSRAGVTA